MSHPYNSLANCIGSLRESVNLLDDSLKTLVDTTSDIPRVRNVILTRRVFGLIPESDLNNAKQSFKNEVEPQLDILMVKIDRSLQRLHRRQTNLQNKRDLQAVRLSGASKRDSVIDLPLNRISKDVDELKLTRLKFLHNKKERLKYSLSRLNLQEQRTRLSFPPLPHPLNEQ